MGVWSGMGSSRRHPCDNSADRRQWLEEPQTGGNNLEKGRGLSPRQSLGIWLVQGRNWGLCGWRPPGASPQGRKKGVGTVLPKYHSDHAPGESGATEPGDHATPWLPSPLCLLTQETSSAFSILPAGTQALELDVIRSKPSSATCPLCDLGPVKLVFSRTLFPPLQRGNKEGTSFGQIVRIH